MNIVWLIVAVVAVIVVWLIATYNGLITLKNRTDESASDIDVQLKRRYDLIPNLVNTVKGYAEHEQGLFEKVATERAKAMGATGMEAKGAAENELSSTLKSIFAIAENYPELKANQNFLQLQDQLADTENKIQAARRFYNGNVRDFNTKIQIFPSNLIAGSLGFKKYEFFATEETEKANVEVKF